MPLCHREPRLPFPTKIVIIHGDEIEEYIIPDDQRQSVLEQLYPFDPLPSLDDVLYDLHSDKLFQVRQYRVLRETGMNWLVSPYYEEGGGTVIDWMPPEWADQVGEDEDDGDGEDEGSWLPDPDEDRSDWLAHDGDRWA